LNNPRQVASTLKSDQAWSLIQVLNELDLAFSQADLDKIISSLQKLKNLKL
jgi:hypothetical protein